MRVNNLHYNVTEEELKREERQIAREQIKNMAETGKTDIKKSIASLEHIIIPSE